MRIALVHDYLSQDGGAERVLKAFHEIWPEAPIFVLFHDKEKIGYLPAELVNESFISKMPFGRSLFQWYLPMMPMATERHNLHEFDIVLSSTSAFAKGVLTRPDTLHISYCHTPPRYLWTDTHEYLAELRHSRIIKALLPGIIHKLRLWDKMSVDRVDYFIANSRTVRRRIYKYYRRESDVIYPPVDTSKFRLAHKISDYFVAGGRLVPYKRTDIVIKTFNRLGWPLKIFGTGPEYKSLRATAKPNIEFLGKITDEEKASLLSQAAAFIHPQLEDSGITPLEAMASGRPVIAYSMGGATETVKAEETGTFFHKQNWESLLDALLRFRPESWDGEHIRAHTIRFDINNFKSNIKDFVEHRYDEFRRGLNQEALIK